VRRRRAASAAVLLAGLAGLGYGVSQLGNGNGDPAGTGSPTAGGTATHRTATGQHRRRPTGTVTLSAVGDTMLGSSGSLPPDPGSYFDAVKGQLTGDVRFANLEGTLTDQTSGKCGAHSTDCFEFRAPPSWARYLKAAGFSVVSNANNHSFDFGQAGLDDTVDALDRAGIAHTGRPGEIAYVTARRLRLAFVGFAGYPNTAPLNDTAAARALIRQADAHADIVVVAMNAGAEGVAAQHLTGSTEYFDGEDRGDPERFARMAIDAGADLIIGYSPHVLRAMEIYRHRLIAYSLGDFAGYRNFATAGALGISGILHVKLGADGRFLSGRLVSTELDSDDRPLLDPDDRADALVEELSREDLARRGAHVAPDGTVT